MKDVFLSKKRRGEKGDLISDDSEVSIEPTPRDNNDSEGVSFLNSYFLSISSFHLFYHYFSSSLSYNFFIKLEI